MLLVVDELFFDVGELGVKLILLGRLGGVQASVRVLLRHPVVPSIGCFESGARRSGAPRGATRAPLQHGSCRASVSAECASCLAWWRHASRLARRYAPAELFY